MLIFEYLRITEEKSLSIPYYDSLSNLIERKYIEKFN